MKLKIFFLAFFVSLNAYSETFSFDAVWEKVKSESPLISKEMHQLKAAQLASSRSDKHWLPSLSLGASAFSTDDPAGNFYSNLSQRQISATDFVLTNMNEPGRHTFEKLTVGLDLPLYEGGKKSAESRALSNLSESARMNRNAAVLGEYIETVKTYAKLGSLSLASKRLSSLAENISGILSKYSIGGQANPVGYSGILGLKSLKNRIEGEQLVIQSKELSSREILNVKAKLGETTWVIESENVIPFLNRTMPVLDEAKLSYVEASMASQSEAIENMRIAEKSRFLPRVGLFANEDLTHGSRDTGTSFTGGVYLQWSLFNPDNLNRVDEKNEVKLAASQNLRVTEQTSVIGRKSLLQSEETLVKNLALLLDSEKLLTEQVKVASRLFQSGAISALQLAEVLNRRVDLVLSLLQAEQEMVEIRAQRLMLTQADGVKL